MQISVIGSGYVGLVAATCLAELGHKVVCVDSDSTKIAALNAGETLIHEDYLQELLSRHRGNCLSFSTDLQEAARNSTVIFIAVGTPSAENGAVDLSCVEAVVQSLADCDEWIQSHRGEEHGTGVHQRAGAETHCRPKAARMRTLTWFQTLNFCAKEPPLRTFFIPDRIVVGASSERAARIMREIYAPLIDGSYAQLASAVPKPEPARAIPMYIETSPRSAELIKHASNAYLALKISFINAVASFCESVGANIEEVSRGIGSDSRIGPEFLRAGIGYGGSCFPKDVAAFRAVTHEFGFEFPLLDEIKRINDEQRVRFIGKVRSALGTIKGKKLAVLGLAFKDGTDDVRESPAINVIEQLLEEKCHITAFDPAAMDRARQILGSRIKYVRRRLCCHGRRRRTADPDGVEGICESRPGPHQASPAVSHCAGWPQRFLADRDGGSRSFLLQHRSSGARSVSQFAEKRPERKAIRK